MTILLQILALFGSADFLAWLTNLLSLFAVTPAAG